MDDVIVIGAGLSGLLSTFIAHERGAKVRLIAQGIGSIMVTPGWVSIADSASGAVLNGAQAIAAEAPEHPYALAGLDALRGGIDALRRMGAAIGLPFVGDLTQNLRLPTALGKVQRPALAPQTMAAGNDHVHDALYVGFSGWRDFYPALSGLRNTLIQLPGGVRAWDIWPDQLARAFDDPATRKAAVQGIRHALGDAKAVAFPAVLGFDDPIAAQNDLQDQLGVPVFEVPTLPPSVPGARLFQKLRRYLLDHRVRIQIGHPVTRGMIEQGRVVGVEVAAAGKPAQFRAHSVILATGGLYGGGLISDDRGHIFEPIFDLPVNANPERETWFGPELLVREGHAVHRFGVQSNTKLQAIGRDGVIERLYLAGHLLAQPGTTPTAHFAEGVSLATAYKAVESALE
jgi:glycerol-3-phosphate dehydrogenase subunit B